MKTKLITLLTIGLALITSCSSDEDATTEINPINIIEVTSSKEYAFIEESVVIAIQANGYSEIVVSSEDNIDIEIINDTTYIVTSEERTEATIEVTLTNGDFTKSENIDIEFVEHGVIDFEIVEGLQIDIDTSDKLIDLLGEPYYKYSNNSNTEERWDYPDLGIRFEIKIDTEIVSEARLYSYNFNRTFENENYTSGIYPYEISEGIKIENSQLTTNTVLENYGNSYLHSTLSNSETTHYFDYETEQVVFFYFADDIDDYSEKTVPYVTIY